MAPHLPLDVYLAVAGLLVAVILVALTASFDMLLMRAALRAAARSAGRACVARLLAAALVGALFAAAAFLIRVHFDSFTKVKERQRRCAFLVRP